MALLRLAALGALGYAGYKYYEKNYASQNEAFAKGQAGGPNRHQVRDSGPGAMADEPNRKWTETDEELDETFPASDPPANY
ncbi:hypothetical protein [Aurantiacibacter spongiae]|uniref:Uncharacterized protein n=1 Tax=Aurantiacibacter spongiae TaxID=2488860 RepID=A0A3N5DQK0_9SPHN|nr:hypothetical protein [Aurantiacibacter spongiae]RPF71451.1 hypothetical protein EG799_07350 [Aurantiacibacter spongiae]